MRRMGNDTLKRLATGPHGLFGTIRRRIQRTAIAAGAASALVAASPGAYQAPPVQVPAGEALTDPVALLQKRIERGEAQLRYSGSRGYLPSLLAELRLPTSSQSLVFSKTSIQADEISPSAPRAVYFNDDVYVAWIPGAPMLEIASTDPRYGTIFYTMSQGESASPSIQRLEQPCTSCHGSSSDDVPAPLLLMLSAVTSESGEPLGDFSLTTDRTPLKEKWGGWYVSGSTGGAAHMGRTTPPSLPEYPSPHSDAAALLVLAHQTDVHNRISEAAQALRFKGGAASLDLAVEPLVKALLFSGEAKLPAPVRGSSDFGKEFTAQGPADGRGRSLRDFDLETRLFRYPLSYLIYSDSLAQLPLPAREYVYRRLRDVLAGKETGEAFSHLSPSDRTAVLEILTSTLPDFQRWIAAH